MRRMSPAPQPVRFLMASAINAVVGFGVYAFAILVADLDYRIAVFLSLFAVMTAGFLQSRLTVFRVGRPGSLWRYILLFAALYIFGVLVIGAVISQGFGEIEGYIVSAILSVPISYTAQKFWVFRSHRP